MPHEDALIATLAVSLALAFFFGLFAVRLRMPPLVGYLVAGVALSPYTPGWVADVHLAPQLAEIGVMLLMFGVGTHFSLRDLLAVKSMPCPGRWRRSHVATAWGHWPRTCGAGRSARDCSFGLALSVASTVVLLRALEQRGTLHSEDGQIAVGWLLVEDLVTVLALVLLPALAGVLGGEVPAGAPTGSLWSALAVTLGKVSLFIVLMLVVGARVFPWILRRVVRTQSRELFTLAAIALALGVAYGCARLFDVSVALGAFFAGMVISGSDSSERAATYLQPLQDVFAALFFVAVGMLFEPSVLWLHPAQVLTVLAIIVVGKSLAALAIVRMLGKPFGTALSVAAALAQIGEFSFILAVMGVSMKTSPPTGRATSWQGPCCRSRSTRSSAPSAPGCGRPLRRPEGA